MASKQTSTLGAASKEDLKAIYDVYCNAYSDQLCGADEDYSERFAEEYAPPAEPWDAASDAKACFMSLVDEMMQDRTDIPELLPACGLTMELAAKFGLDIEGTTGCQKEGL